MSGITFAGTLVKGVDEIFVSEHEDDKAGGPLKDMDYRLRGNDMGAGYGGLEVLVSGHKDDRLG